MTGRFLTLDQLAEELATSKAQAYAMVRSGELPAIRIGGRKQWRIERAKLEEYIDRNYQETAEYVRVNPMTERVDD
jgi:excisionase family DNA binding protein